MKENNTVKQTSAIKDIVEGVLFGIMLLATIYIWSFILP